MKTDIRKQDIDVTWQNLNPGTVVTGGATAPEFNTGEWRVNVPVLDMDKCKQCLMCVPVCPDSSIPVKKTIKTIGTSRIFVGYQIIRR